MDLKALTKKIPYQWRVQSYNNERKTCTCVAYIDARDVMNLLDEAVGAENWQDDYKLVGTLLMAGIGIKVNDEWIWKWDTGVSGDIEQEKSSISDSFKRAGVKWGIGRFLYELPMVKLNAHINEKGSKYNYPIDKFGNRVWDITKSINETRKDS